MKLEVISSTNGIILDFEPNFGLRVGDQYERMFDPRTWRMYYNVTIDSLRDGESHAMVSWTNYHPVREGEDWRKIDQQRLHDPQRDSYGDCARASIATILGLALTEVPDFDVNNPSVFWSSIDSFMDDLGFDFSYTPRIDSYEGLYLASGSTDRSKTTTHMVVMRDDELFHDPHPSRSGLTHVKHIYRLIAVDPSRFLRRETKHLRLWPQPNRLRYLEKLNVDVCNRTKASI